MSFSIRELDTESLTESYLVIMGRKELFEPYIITHGSLADAVEKVLGISKEEFEVIDRDGLYFLDFKQTFYEENKEFMEELRSSGEEDQVYPAFLMDGETFESCAEKLNDGQNSVLEETEEEEDLVSDDLVNTPSDEIGDILVLDVIQDLQFSYNNEIILLKRGFTLKITPEKTEEDDLFTVVVSGDDEDVMTLTEVPLEQVEFLVSSDEIRVSVEESVQTLLEKFCGRKKKKDSAVNESVRVQYAMIARRGRKS